MTEQKLTTDLAQEEGGSQTETLENFRELYEQTLSNIEEGNIVKGTIVKITPNEVLVDINYKSEGVIPNEEFLDLEDFKVGDEIEVFLETLEDEDGTMLLSKTKVDRTRNWEKTISSCKEGDVVKGKVIKKVKGGLIVNIGVEAFLPASQLDIKPVPNINEYLGQSYDFKILKISEERKNVVVSRRELLEVQRQQERTRLLAEINEGDWIKGVVKNITDFGAFIDLNGIDGLLHITDMTWGRINHPSEVLSLGDEIEVVVLKFDKESARISLGLKQKLANPWATVEEKYPVGDVVTGKVVNIMPYGAFVELENGIEGLIHISEFSWTKRINHPSEILAVGDSIEAMVLNIEKEKEKISLGIKQTEFNPWTAVEEKYPEGKKIKGTVRNITSYGAFVELEEGIDGLIHVSDISWTKKINSPAEVLKKGDEVEAVVISVDPENKKIALGIKQLSEDPWENIDQQYEIGQVVKGHISKITGFGVFVSLGNDLEGLIHASQLAETTPTKIEDVFSVDDEITAMIMKIDPIDRKIALSVKELLLADKRKTEVKQKTDKGTKEAPKVSAPRRKKRESSFESTSLLSEQLDVVLSASVASKEKSTDKVDKKESETKEADKPVVSEKESDSAETEKE